MSRSIGAAIAVLLVASRAHGEEPECPRIAEAAALVRCALARSEPVLRARQELDAAQARRAAAGRFLVDNPTVEVGLGRRSGPDGSTDFDRSVEVAQRVQIGGQRSARGRVADAEVALAQASVEAAQRAIVTEVYSAVAGVWQTRAAAQLAQDQVRAAEQLVAVSRGRERQGVGAALDVDLAEAGQIGARRALANALAERRDAETRLALAVGNDVGLAEAAPLPAQYRPALPMLELEEGAVARRIEVLTARAEGRTAQGRIDLLQRSRIPDVTVAAGARHEDFSSGIGVRLSVPIPLFARSQGEIAEQRSRSAQADVAVRQAELRVRLDVRAAFQAWQRADEIERAPAPDLERRLREDVESLRNAYERGTMSLTAALLALRETQGARKALIDARADVVTTSLRLARAAAVDLNVPARAETPR